MGRRYRPEIYWSKLLKIKLISAGKKNRWNYIIESTMHSVRSLTKYMYIMIHQYNVFMNIKYMLPHEYNKCIHKYSVFMNIIEHIAYMNIMFS
jgi:hypothetical protein